MNDKISAAKARLPPLGGQIYQMKQKTWFHELSKHIQAAYVDEQQDISCQSTFTPSRWMNDKISAAQAHLPPPGG